MGRVVAAHAAIQDFDVARPACLGKQDLELRRPRLVVVHAGAEGERVPDTRDAEGARRLGARHRAPAEPVVVDRVERDPRRVATLPLERPCPRRVRPVVETQVGVGRLSDDRAGRHRVRRRPEIEQPHRQLADEERREQRREHDQDRLQQPASALRTDSGSEQLHRDLAVPRTPPPPDPGLRNPEPRETRFGVTWEGVVQRPL